MSMYNEILKRLHDDLQPAVPRLTMEALKGCRDSWFEDALTCRSSTRYNRDVSTLRYLESMAKAHGVVGMPRPASSVPAFVSSQANPATIHAKRDLTDLVRRIWWLLFSSDNVDIHEIIEASKHGPGATADGFTSYDKWLASVADNEIAEALDPLHRLPRVPETSVSKYFDVPKTAWKMRGICAESTQRQLLQQGLGGVLASRLYPFVDLSKQVENQLMALQPDTETIDLSSASDTLNLDHLDFLDGEGKCTKSTANMMSQEGLDVPTWIRLLRSTFCSVPSNSLNRDHDQGPVPSRVIVPLSTVASMGCGFCFPFLTSFIVAVCSAVALQHEEGKGAWVSRSEGRKKLFRVFRTYFRVYGDDVVVKTDLALQTRLALELFGFKVNSAKSSYLGDFKETCGLFVLRNASVPNILRFRDLSSISHLCEMQRRCFQQYLRGTADFIRWELLAGQDVQPLDIEEDLNYDLSSTHVVYTQRHHGLRRSWSKARQNAYITTPKEKMVSREVRLADGVGFAATLWGSRFVRSISPTEPSTCRPVMVRTKIYAGSRRD